MPKNLKKESYYYLKKKREERCRFRVGIKGLISHLKHDHRMLRNYLSGTAGDKINTLLAATAYNMIKWMRLKREDLLNSGEPISFSHWRKGKSELDTKKVLNEIGFLVGFAARSSNFVLRWIFQWQFCSLGNLRLSIRPKLSDLFE